jgi:MFS family permease
MAFAAPAAASILGVVAAGSWADRSGPRSPLLAGVAAFVLGLVIAGTATGMPVVVAGRAIQGLGAGALVVALYVVVAQVFPATVQPRVFAAFAAAWVVPSIVGPAAAGWLAEHVGWRWVFLAVPILAVPAMATLRPVLAGGTRPPSKPRAPGERGRLLRGLGAGVAALALHWGGQQDLVVAAITGVVGLTLLVVTVPGLLPRGTFRFRRGLPSVVMLRGVFGTAFFAAEVYLPLLLTTERGLRPGQAGLVLTVAAITWSLGSWVRGRSEGRWSDAGVLRVGALALALGIASVALAVWSAVPVLTPMLGWGLSGFGMGLAYPTTSLLILRLSEPDEVGVNSAALQVNEALCIAVTLAASGPAFAQIIGASASAAFLTVLALPIVLALAAALTASRVTTPQRVT